MLRASKGSSKSASALEARCKVAGNRQYNPLAHGARPALPVHVIGASPARHRAQGEPRRLSSDDYPRQGSANFGR